MIGRRRFMGSLLSSPIAPHGAFVKADAQQTVPSCCGQRNFKSYEAAVSAEIGSEVEMLSILGDNGSRFDYVEAGSQISNPPLASPGGRRWMPPDGVLDIRHCAGASELASDFAGICAQAIDDALKNRWTLNISEGDWETDPVAYGAATKGLLDIRFSHYAKLIGKSQFQHFEGDGVSRRFTLSEWPNAATDEVSAMIVHADDSYTILRNDSANGFSKKDRLFSLNPDAPTIFRGEMLVVSSRRSIFSVSGENGDLALRFHGGHFDNGRMGYVASQASGTCVALTTIRDLYWDGGPVFENSSRMSRHPASLLELRGDSGLVLGNVERASVYGAQFLYQPDVGNYTTGLARGGEDLEDYHLDDGRFINFYGAVAKGCGTGFRSARDGGGYGLYGCSVDECNSGYLSANVSAGMPAARNISIHGLTCRKIAFDAVDMREVRSAVINGLLIEDWGRRADGTAPERPSALLAFGEVKHLDAYGLRCRFEEWEPVESAGVIVSFANGRTTDVRMRVSIELPASAIGTGTKGVLFSGGIGPQGDIDLDLTTTNIDEPISFGGNAPRSFIKAKVTDIRIDRDATYTLERYNIAGGRKYAETHGVPFEQIGKGVPSLEIAGAEGARLTLEKGSGGTFVRQGSMISLKLSLTARLEWGNAAPSGPLRIGLNGMEAPPIDELFQSQVSVTGTHAANPAPSAETAPAKRFVLEPEGEAVLLLFAIAPDGSEGAFDPGIWYRAGTDTLRLDIQATYLSMTPAV